MGEREKPLDGTKFYKDKCVYSCYWLFGKLTKIINNSKQIKF